MTTCMLDQMAKVQDRKHQVVDKEQPGLAESWSMRMSWKQLQNEVASARSKPLRLQDPLIDL